MALKYRPSNITTYSNPRVYSRFIRQFMDPMNFATDKGKFRKSHAYINSVLESNIPIKIQRLKVSLFAIQQHLKAIEPSRLLYYTNRPDTRIHMVCLDIDPTKTTTKSDLDAVKDLLLTIFPGSFWDYGSSGQSLHFYVLFDTETLYNSLCLNVTTSYPLFINHLLQAISDSFKGYLEAHYNVIMDGIKGTLSDYTYFKDRKGRILYKEIRHSGTLCKLPLPRTTEEFQRLYSMPIIPFHILVQNLFFHQPYFDFLFSRIHKDIDISCSEFIECLPKDYTKAHGLSALPEPQTPWLNPPDLFTYLPFPLLNYIMSAHLQDSVPKIDCSKPDIKVHSHKKIQEKTESCAFQRSLQFCLKYMRTYYKEKKQLPSVEEFRDAYRSAQGTGEELSNDRNRLNYIYEYVKRNFNPEKIRKQKKGKYITGEFLPYITISDEEIVQTRDNKSSYRRNITRKDIDLAAGYYFLNLIGKLEQKEFAYKDLSVPQDHLCKFFESHKNEGRIKYGCNAGKAKALREILIAMGWLRCVDTTYYTTKNKAGRARRYVLTPQFPRYREFEEVVGKDLIEQWTRKLDHQFALDQIPKKTG